MFYWLIAIPFIVAMMMFAIYPTSNVNLKRIDDVQVNSLAFRMAQQHSAAMKAISNYRAKRKKGLPATRISDGLIFTEESLLEPYVPSGYLFDFKKIKTSIRCFSADNQDGVSTGMDCADSRVAFVYVFTVLNQTDPNAARWLTGSAAFDLVEKLLPFRGTIGSVTIGLAVEKEPAPEKDKVPLGSKRALFGFYNYIEDENGEIIDREPYFVYIPAALSCVEGDVKGKVVMMTQVYADWDPFPIATLKCDDHNTFALP